MAPEYRLTRYTAMADPILSLPGLGFGTSYERITPRPVFEEKCNKIVHIDMSTKVLKVVGKKRIYSNNARGGEMVGERQMINDRRVDRGDSENRYESRQRERGRTRGSNTT